MSNPVWATPQEAAVALKLHVRTLQRYRMEGVLPPGKCWIRKDPFKARGRVLYNVTACREFFASATAANHGKQEVLA
jgi:hypothetical protein